MTTTGKNRIMIYGPKDDGTYIVECGTAASLSQRRDTFKTRNSDAPAVAGEGENGFNEKDIVWNVIFTSAFVPGRTRPKGGKR